MHWSVVFSISHFKMYNIDFLAFKTCIVGACTVRSAFIMICDDQLGGFDGCHLQEQCDGKEDSLASPNLTK